MLRRNRKLLCIGLDTKIFIVIFITVFDVNRPSMLFFEGVRGLSLKSPQVLPEQI